MTEKIRTLLAGIGDKTKVALRVVFPDGHNFRNCEGPPEVTLFLRNARALRRVALFGHAGLIESYFAGDMDVHGHLGLAFRAGLDAGFDRRPNRLLQLRNLWHEYRFSNRSLAQAQRNARFHYGLGQDFYRHWLDVPAMMYTCAYWKEGTQSLEEAQRNKMDHVCRKVRLQAGETFADIGSGWGGLLFHAWERYGARGTGINNTTEQVRETREEIARRGLQDKIEVLACDFREVPGQFDKLLSIGTLEHAGRDQLPQVIQAHADFLKPGGLGVIHFIGHVGERDTEWWIRQHVFPGGWIPGLADVLEHLERAGLEVLDVENLRRHYALTLDAWSERFDRNWEAIHRLDPVKFDERFRRTWRSYLYACAEMFRSPGSTTHLFQIVVSKGNVAGRYPMSRGFLYGADSV
jgi:cyclopropane-fatty-acyl-phospholipid synthase